MTIPIPMMVWLNNNNSVTRSATGGFQKEGLSDFIFSMNESIKFLKQHMNVKDIKFIPGTVKHILEKYYMLMGRVGEEEEKQKVKEQLLIMRELIAEAIPRNEFNKNFGLK